MKTEVKSLDQLGEKISRAVELVSRLRKDNETLRGKVERLEASAQDGSKATRQVETMRITQDQLEKELKLLSDEKATVLSRVDDLLSDLAKLDLD